MLGLLYADLSNSRLLRTLGGQPVSLPSFVQGSVIRVGFRLCEQTDGVLYEMPAPDIDAVRATIGPVDLAPTSGGVQIKVGNGAAELGTNLTTSIALAATAETIATALNATTIVGTTYGAASVTLDNGAWVIVFAGETAAVPLSIVGNTLAPISFGRVNAWEANDTWVHSIRFQRAPVAFTTEFVELVPPAPSVTEIQNGQDVDGVKLNERQKLFVPAAFRGSYTLTREGLTTGLLTRNDDEESLAAALADIADDDGEFIVTPGPNPGEAYIEFAGTMAATPQDLLTVTVEDAPAGDPWISLTLDSAPLTESFRAADTDSLTLPLEITIDLTVSAVTRRYTIFRGDITVLERIGHSDLEEVVDIDYVRSPYGTTYVPFTSSQLTTGNKAYNGVFGNGSSTEFEITHNLGSDSVGIQIRENVSDGALLIPGTDYTCNFDSDDAATITLAGTYASSPPTSNALVALFVRYDQTSAFDTHTHTIAQIVDLQATLDAQSARIAALEALAPTGVLTLPDASGGSISRNLPSIWRVLRSAVAVDAPANLSAFTRPARLADSRLLPAVHDASLEMLDDVLDAGALPAPSGTYIGKVYYAETALPAFPSGGIRVGDYAACDGREWYRVARPGEKYDTITVSAIESDDEILTTSAAHGLVAGDRVQLLTLTGGTGLTALANYYVESAGTTTTLKLALLPGGSAIDVTLDGSGTLRRLETGSSYYPVEFDTELFREIISADEFPVDSVLSASFGIEAMMIGPDRRPRDRQSVAAHYRVVVEVGEIVRDATPGTPGSNLDSVRWQPVIETRIELTPVPKPAYFGLTIARTLSEITVDKTVYKTTSAGPTLASANIAVRARLTQFDVDDDSTDPRGLVLIRGLNVGLDGKSADGIGKITIA